MRAPGNAPTARVETRRKIGMNNRARQRAIHGRAFDPGVFKRDILPTLQRVTVTRMAAATGLSIQYCSRVKSGLNVPHPMHLPALEMLAESSASQ